MSFVARIDLGISERKLDLVEIPSLEVAKNGFWISRKNETDEYGDFFVYDYVEDDNQGRTFWIPPSSVICVCDHIKNNP